MATIILTQTRFTVKNDDEILRDSRGLVLTPKKRRSSTPSRGRFQLILTAPLRGDMRAVHHEFRLPEVERLHHTLDGHTIGVRSLQGAGSGDLIEY